MAKRGTLIKKGYGVYLAKHHIPKENDVFAHSVALAGGTAYLRGASVIALLKLAPTNPGIVYLGATSRVRRRLPANLRLVDMRPCNCVEWDVKVIVDAKEMREATPRVMKRNQIPFDRSEDLR